MTHPNIKDHILEDILVRSPNGAVVLDDSETWSGIDNVTVVVQYINHDQNNKKWYEFLSLNDLISCYYDHH